MEDVEFKLYDVVVCTETGERGTITRLSHNFAVVEFPSGVRCVEYLDILFIDRPDKSYPSWRYYERKAFTKD